MYLQEVFYFKRTSWGYNTKGASMKKRKREVVFFTKDKNNTIRVYMQNVNLRSESKIKRKLSNQSFLTESEKFYHIFDIKTL